MTDDFAGVRARYRFSCTRIYPRRLFDAKLRELDDAGVDIDAFPGDMTIYAVMEMSVDEARRSYPKAA